MGYTIDQLEAMGAKPVTQQTTSSTPRKKYTPEELKSVGAIPVPLKIPESPKKSFADKAAGVLDTVFGFGKVGELIGTQIAKAKATPEERQYIEGPNASEVAGSIGQGLINFVPVGRVAKGIGLASKALGAGEGIAKTVGAVTAGAGTGYGYDVASKVAHGEDSPITPGGGTAFGTVIPLIPPVLRGAGRLAGEGLGVTTGTGYGTIKAGLQSASKGGREAEAFRSALRGGVSPETIVEDSRNALGTIISDRTRAYRSQLEKLRTNVKEFDTVPIVQKFNKQLEDFGVSFTDEGLPDFSRSPGLQRYEKDLYNISNVLKNWGTKVGDTTVVGIDKLKQVIDDFRIGSRDSAKFDSFVTTLRNEAKNLIKNEPGYDKLVRDYEESTGLIKEIQRGLSLGDKTQTDTAFRKLTTALRTNNEFRKQLVDELDAVTGGVLTPQIAGQQLSELVPRGLARVAAGTLGAGGLVTGVGVIPILKAMLFTSPRLVGELLNAVGYGGAKMRKVLEVIAPKGLQFPGDVLYDHVTGKTGIKTPHPRSQFDGATRLSLKDRKIETRAFERINREGDALIERYLHRNGKVVNTDNFRPLFTADGYAGYNAAAVQEPASYLSKKVYTELLKKNPEKYVTMLSGGSGTGKTSAVRNLPSIAEANRKSAVILDSNLSSYKSAKSKIDEAKKAGKKIRIEYVYRDPLDSFEEGVVKRMIENTEEMGRLVPSHVVAENHIDSWDVVRRLQDEGERVLYIDNSLGRGNARIATRDELEKKIKYPSKEELTKRFNQIAERLYGQGKISRDQLEGYRKR